MIGKLLVFVLAVTAPALAQGSDPVIQALLAEVRQLRLAIERSNAVVPRVQIALQRYQAQEGRVTRLSERVSAVRSSLARMSAEHTRFEEEIRQTEARAAQEQDPAQRKIMQDQVTAMKLGTGRNAAVEEQMRAEEAELANALRTEQAKLDEATAQLNALERALEGK